jgi:hypothetical protein
MVNLNIESSSISKTAQTFCEVFNFTNFYWTFTKYNIPDNRRQGWKIRPGPWTWRVCKQREKQTKLLDRKNKIHREPVWILGERIMILRRLGYEAAENFRGDNFWVGL